MKNKRLFKQGRWLARSATLVVLLSLVVVAGWTILQLMVMGLWLATYHFGLWAVLPVFLVGWAVGWGLGMEAPLPTKVVVLLLVGLSLALCLSFVEKPLLPDPLHPEYHPIHLFP